MTKNFIQYMSLSHLADKNIALYQNENGQTFMLLENLVTGENVAGAHKYFDSVEAAEEWWSELPGQGVAKLNAAMDILLCSVSWERLEDITKEDWMRTRFHGGM